jgi:vancomycin resistance protein YoaR
MTTYPAKDNLSPYLRPPEPKGPNPWLIRLPVLFITGGILLLLTLVILIGAFRLAYTDRITPGVTAMGIKLGGMTRDEAAAALGERFDYDRTTVFTFYDGAQEWQMTAAELGVTFDVEATIDQITIVGSDPNLTGSLIDQALAWLNGESVAPVVRYDQSVTVARLMEMAAAVNSEPVDAVLRIEGGQVMTSPGQAGRMVDIFATLSRLEEHITALRPGEAIPLVINETPPLVWSAEEAASQVRAAFSGPLELIADGPNGERLGPWTASVDQIAALLVVELVDNGEGSRTYHSRIDMSAFESFLNELAPGLLMPPRDARFRFDPNTQQLQVIQPAVSGRSLNVVETLKRLEQAVFRYDDRSVPMAFDYTQPRYHDGVTAAELGITEMVAEATTYYTGSTANRRHNIAEGAARYDGLLIGPGEEFSFNYWLGPITTEAGFVESLVISGERTVDGIGGGLCQVSTTIFRAAFYGGFTIIERNSHAYRVGFYELAGQPTGLDAAIWSPDRDFRFQNDTPYHLLISTAIYPANNALQFRFYSTNPGRVVEVQQPVVRNLVPALPTRFEGNLDIPLGQSMQVDWAAEGADVNVTRIIRDRDGNEIKRDNIFTHYLPWRAIFQVNPNDSRLVNQGG